jgi:hypothetical protein
MNTHRRFIVTLVGIITTCVMSAGAASARPAPSETGVSGTSSPSVIAAQHAAGNSAGAKDRAERLLKQQSYIQRVERAYAAKAAAAARSRAAQQHAGVLHGRSLVTPESTANQGSTSNSPSHSGDGSEVAVLAVTALAGLALGAAGSTASRRLRNRPRMAA